MKAATTMIIAGALALIAGIVALIFPLPASLAVTVLVGWSLLIASALGLYAALADKLMPGRGWAVFFNLLELAVGVWILANPLAGMVSLTIMVGAMMFASGVMRILISRSYRANGSLFWTMLLSGAVSLGLGLYVLFALPAASMVLLGLLVAFELIVIGAMLLALGLGLKSLTRF
ncbi:MAG TPA: hypothetical protein ENJ52_09135 [Aliiroseovarius sp.]|nr:hypothetical protein [Aliiroseovarius sp.]